MSGSHTLDDRCDLDPNKICDNCCKCIDSDEVDYKVVIADIALSDGEGYLIEQAGETDSDDSSERYIGVSDELLSEWNDKLILYEQELAEKEAVEKAKEARKFVGKRKR